MEICDVVGDDPALERLDLPQDLVRNRDGVCPRPLGDAQGDGGLFVGDGGPGRARAKEHILAWLLRPVHNRRHVAQVNGLSAMHADDDVAGVLRAGEEAAGLQQDLAVVIGERAGDELAVGRLEQRDDVRRAEVARGELRRVEQDAQLPALAADERRLSHQRHLLHGVVHFGDDAAQRVMVLPRAVEGERQDRHVVNGLGLDEREGDALGDAVEVGLQLLVEEDQAALDVLADLEADDGQALALAGGRVDVFHLGDFPEQLLHRPGGALLDLLGAEAGHGDQHVNHRHLDLRLLLARQEQRRRRAQQNRGDDEQRRQLGVNERPGDAPRDAQARRVRLGRVCAHGRRLLRLERLTVPQVPGPFDDHRLAGSQAGENLNALCGLLAGAHEPHLRFAVGGDEQDLKLAAPDQRRGRNEEERGLADRHGEPAKLPGRASLRFPANPPSCARCGTPGRPPVKSQPACP